MAEQRACPGMAEVAGAFGAQEIDDPGRRRVILGRPGEQIVDRHEESLPDRGEDGRSPPKRASSVAVPWKRRDWPTLIRRPPAPLLRNEPGRLASAQYMPRWQGESESMSYSPQVLSASEPNDKCHDRGQSHGSLPFPVIPITTILRVSAASRVLEIAQRHRCNSRSRAAWFSRTSGSSGTVAGDGRLLDLGRAAGSRSTRYPVSASRSASSQSFSVKGARAAERVSCRPLQRNLAPFVDQCLGGLIIEFVGQDAVHGRFASLVRPFALRPELSRNASPEPRSRADRSNSPSSASGQAAMIVDQATFSIDPARRVACEPHFRGRRLVLGSTSRSLILPRWLPLRRRKGIVP